MIPLTWPASALKRFCRARGGSLLEKSSCLLPARLRMSRAGGYGRPSEAAEARRRVEFRAGVGVGSLFADLGNRLLDERTKRAYAEPSLAAATLW